MATGNLTGNMPEWVLAAIQCYIETNADVHHSYPDETAWWDTELFNATAQVIDPAYGQLELTLASGKRWLISVEPA